MKFDCGLTLEEEYDLLKQWHKHFCWLPVRIAHRDCRWLEFVERKGTYKGMSFRTFWEWEYRSIK